MQLCLLQCVGLQIYTRLFVWLSTALQPLNGPHTSWSKSVVNNFSVQTHGNTLSGNFLKFVTKIAFIKAYILRKIENNPFGGGTGAIWLRKVSNKFIHIYPNTPFFFPSSEPTHSAPSPTQAKEDICLVFSSCWEILILISLPRYFRPRPTVTCEKRKDCTDLPDTKGFWRKWTGMFRCSNVASPSPYPLF